MDSFSGCARRQVDRVQAIIRGAGGGDGGRFGQDQRLVTGDALGLDLLARATVILGSSSCGRLLTAGKILRQKFSALFPRFRNIRG